MNQNWIVENLNNAFSTWNGKLTELWGLVTTSPQSFKGGAVWGVMQSLHSAMVGIGYALIVLFFAISLFKNTMNFHELKRPEAALHYLIRFVAAKALVGYGMDIMLNIFSICNGVVSDMAAGMGGISQAMVTLPGEIQSAIENVGFLASIPLWLVTILGSLFITVLSFVMILTVYGRFFRLYMYTALAPLPLASFAGESTQSVGISFVKSYIGVCLEGAVIVLACIIYGQRSTSANRTDDADADAAEHRPEPADRPDGLDAVDERLAGPSRGTGDAADLQPVIQEPQAESDTTPSAFSVPISDLPPLSDELILGLLAKESSSRADNAAILEYFNEHPDLAERSAFCKHCYKQIYTYLFVDDHTVGFIRHDMYLELWEGNYLTKTAQINLTWDAVAAKIADLIGQGRLMVPIKATPVQQQMEQLTLTPEDSEKAGLPSHEQQAKNIDLAAEAKKWNEPIIDASGKYITEQDITDALCKGGGFEDSKFRIQQYFSAQVLPIEVDQARWLKKEYGIGGGTWFFRDGGRGFLNHMQTVVMKDAREDTPTPTPDNTPTPDHTPQPTPNTTPAPTPVPAAPTATPTPLLTIPKTGDNSSLGLLLAIAGISLAGLAVLVHKSARRKDIAPRDDDDEDTED